MNHDCHGDIFERWGKRWGRCFADGSFFDFEDGIEFCPSCKRPWLGMMKRDDYKPDEDSSVLIGIDLPHFKRLADERGRKITHLEGKLNLCMASLHDSAKK